MSQKRGILERLSNEVIIGDGGFVMALEKRGYVKAGVWTTEAVVEHPEAVKQLHREFLRAGADVMQSCTYDSSDAKVFNCSHLQGKSVTCETINDAACKIAHEVASEGDALFAGCVSQTPAYKDGKGKDVVQSEYRRQMKVFVDNNVDFIICEYFWHLEDMEWAIEVALETGKVVASTMCIGPEGDRHGVPAGECAVRMVRAGAKIVGVNCNFGPSTCLKTMRAMKIGLEAAGILDTVHLMCQPIAFHTPDSEKSGMVHIPQYPFAMEPRTLTRWDVQKYAREAYELGVRYIGGCCGFEPYHVRAIAEELSSKRGGRLPPASEKHSLWGSVLTTHAMPSVRARAGRDYWENLQPATGRPYSPALSSPDS